MSNTNCNAKLNCRLKLNTQVRHPFNFSILKSLIATTLPHPRWATVFLIYTCTLFLCIYALPSNAENSPSERVYNSLGHALEHKKVTTVAELFPKAQVNSLQHILTSTQHVTFNITEPNTAHMPSSMAKPGLVIYISPTPDATPQTQWRTVLNNTNLIWIAAENFGNTKPSAQRSLVALMALKLASQQYQLDKKRIYVAGMSGGGRIASKVISKFPQYFTGGLFMTGVDFWTQSEQHLIPHMIKNKFVFLTGFKDFNRTEITRVYKRYIKAGAQYSTLLDYPKLGHEYPNETQFLNAINALDNPIHLKTEK